MEINKNRYILVEEFNELVSNLENSKKGESFEVNKLITLIHLIYNNGHNIKDAIKVSGIKKTHRSIQRNIEKFSNRNIKLIDLRRSYLFSNPSLIYNRNRGLRKPLSPRKRWIILSRDKFQCVTCGKSSKDEILHVDHIIPFSKGGTEKLSNLRTLCGTCNLGRGNLMIDLKINKENNTTK